MSAKFTPPLLVLLPASFRILVGGISNSLFPPPRKQKSLVGEEKEEGRCAMWLFAINGAMLQNCQIFLPLLIQKPLDLPWEYPFTQRGGSQRLKTNGKVERPSVSVYILSTQPNSSKVDSWGSSKTETGSYTHPT